MGSVIDYKSCMTRQKQEVPAETESETVKVWLDKFKASGNSIDAEIEETKGTISNERLWEKGSADMEEAECHRQNIEELTEYLNCLMEMKQAG